MSTTDLMRQVEELKGRIKWASQGIYDGNTIYLGELKKQLAVAEVKLSIQQELYAKKPIHERLH